MAIEKNFQKSIKLNHVKSDIKLWPKFGEDNNIFDTVESGKKFKPKNGVFLNSKAYTWAEIDAEYNFSKHSIGIIDYRNFDRFSGHQVTFITLSINGGPGGFIEYIQYRRRLSLSVGMNPLSKSSQKNWNVQRLDTGTFRIYNGKDGTGRIYLPGEIKGLTNFINIPYLTIVTVESLSKKFVVDYSIRLKLKSRNEEFVQSNCAFFGLLTGIWNCKPGGTLIWSIKSIKLEITKDLIYLLTYFFETVTIFDPITCNKRYIICSSAQENNRNWLFQQSELLTIAEKVTKKPIQQLFKSRNSEFNSWLEKLSVVPEKQKISRNDIDTVMLKWSLPFFPREITEKITPKVSLDHIKQFGYVQAVTLAETENIQGKFNPKRYIEFPKFTLSRTIVEKYNLGLRFEISMYPNILNSQSYFDPESEDQDNFLFVNLGSDIFLERITQFSLKNCFIIVPVWPELTEMLRSKAQIVDILHGFEVFKFKKDKKYPVEQIINKNYYLIKI